LSRFSGQDLLGRKRERGKKEGKRGNSCHKTVCGRLGKKDMKSHARKTGGFRKGRPASPGGLNGLGGEYEPVPGGREVGKNSFEEWPKTVPPPKGGGRESSIHFF